MKTSTYCRVIAVAFALSLCITMAGCGSKPDGKYTDGSGLETIEFKSGKVTFTAMGNSQTCDYTVDGDKVTMTLDKSGGQAMILTIMKDGTLQGGGMTFKKVGG